jgi:hypothetical protein
LLSFQCCNGRDAFQCCILPRLAVPEPRLSTVFYSERLECERLCSRVCCHYCSDRLLLFPIRTVTINDPPKASALSCCTTATPMDSPWSVLFLVDLSICDILNRFHSSKGSFLNVTFPIRNGDALSNVRTQYVVLPHNPHGNSNVWK